MSTHLDEEAVAALAFDAPINEAQQAHLEACPACQSRALEARAMVGDVGRALEMLEPEPELSRERQAAVFARIERDVRKRGHRHDLRGPSIERIALPLLLATVTALMVLVSGVRTDAWLFAALALAGAIACALAHRTRAATFVMPATLGLSAALSILDAEGAGSASLAGDVHCAAVEIMMGVSTALVSVWLMKREGASASLTSLATTLTGGALAGQAGILLTCHTAHGLEHGLVSHTLALVIAASLAWPMSKMPYVRAGER